MAMRIAANLVLFESSFPMFSVKAQELNKTNEIKFVSFNKIQNVHLALNQFEYFLIFGAIFITLARRLNSDRNCRKIGRLIASDHFM